MAASGAMNSRSSLSAPLCALLTLALVPGCSLVKTRGPAPESKLGRDPRCVADRKPAIFDTVLTGVLGGGVALAAVDASSGKTYDQRATGREAVPWLSLATIAAAGSAVYGYIRTNQCAVAQTTWAAGAETRRQEALAQAEAARKAAQEKAEAERQARKAETARLPAETNAADGDGGAAEAHRETLNQYTPDTMQAHDSPVVASAPPSQADATYRGKEGYQKAIWGMRQSEIRTLYPKAEPIDVGGAQLGLLGETAGYKTMTAFYFTRDRLAMVAIAIAEPFSGASERLKAFTNLHDLMATKYGKPLKDGVTWHNTVMQGIGSENIATSILMGWAEHSTIWKTEESMIVLSAKRGPGTIHVTIGYTSKALFQELQSEDDAAKIDDL